MPVRWHTCVFVCGSWSVMDDWGRGRKLPPCKSSCQSERCYEAIGWDRLCATLQFFPRAPQYRRSVRTLIKDLMLRSWQTHSLCSELKVCVCVFSAEDLVANTFLCRASHTVLKQCCHPKDKIWPAGILDASLHFSDRVSLKNEAKNE